MTKLILFAVYLVVIAGFIKLVIKIIKKNGKR